MSGASCSTEILAPDIEATVNAGLDPSYICAHKKTGLLATVDNWDKLSPEDQAEWERREAFPHRQTPAGGRSGRTLPAWH